MENGIIRNYALHLEAKFMSKEMPGFSSGVTGSYEAPKVKRVVLDEGGNYVSAAPSGTLGGSPPVD